MNKNLEQINKDLKNYGIRNSSIVCKTPLEQPSKLILNETSGVEPSHYIKVIGVDNNLHIALFK